MQRGKADLDPLIDAIVMDGWQTTSMYELARQLGEGGDGAAFLAQLRGPDGFEKDCVLKIPQSQNNLDQAILNLNEERRLLQRLRHPNIVAVRDFGYIEEKNARGEIQRRLPVLVLEHGGITLSQLLASHGPLEPGLAIAVTLQVCAALAYAHQSNVIHRDIKPDNVLINRVGQVVVIDWGIAKGEHRADKTANDRIKGTPKFLAPEMIRCLELDARVDVWQVGVLLYVMLTGFPPWESKEGRAEDKEEAWKLELAAQILREPHPPILPERTPKEVSAVVDRCLKKRREERYVNMTEVLRALHQALQEARLVAPHIANAELGLHVCAAEEHALTRDPSPTTAQITVPMQAEKRGPIKYGPSIKLAPQDSSEGSIRLSDSMTISPGLLPMPSQSSVPRRDEASALPALSARLRSVHSDDTDEFSAPKSAPRWASALAVLAAVVLGSVLALRIPQEAGMQPSSPRIDAPTARASTASDSPTSGLAQERLREPTPSQGSAREASEALVSEPSRLVEELTAAVAEAPGSVAPAVPTEAALAPRPHGKKPAPPLASLKVVVVPSDAFVALDRRKPVPSPATFADVRPGHHVVRVGLTSGELTKREIIEVGPGDNQVRIVLVDPFANQAPAK